MSEQKFQLSHLVILVLVVSWIFMFVVLAVDKNCFKELACISIGCVASFFVWTKYSSYDEAKGAVLFFPDEKSPCKSFYNDLMDRRCSTRKCWTAQCKFLHRHDPPSSLMKIFLALNEATKKIDLCMYLVTHEYLASFLIHLHSFRNVKIRIITDTGNDESFKSNNQADRLQQSGIEVRASNQIDGALMHNKFVIIDNKKLLQGSFNWTKNAVRRNDECVFVHTNGWVVSKLSSKFEKMWAQRPSRAINPNAGPILLREPSRERRYQARS